MANATMEPGRLSEFGTRVAVWMPEWLELELRAEAVRCKVTVHDVICQRLVGSLVEHPRPGFRYVDRAEFEKPAGWE